MVRRTRLEAQATRERLLDVAEGLILERGLARTALQDIACAAGLTRGAIYWHFADKVALVQAIIDRVDLPMEKALAEAAEAGSGAPWRGLRQMALAPFRLMQGDPRAARVLTILLHRAEFIGELAPLARRHHDAVDHFLQRAQGLFDAAAESGQLDAATSPRCAATALLALVDGLLRMATLADDHRMAALAAPAAVDALLAGLQAGPAGPGRREPGARPAG